MKKKVVGTGDRNRPRGSRYPAGPRSSRAPDRSRLGNRRGAGKFGKPEPARWVIGLHSCEEALRARPKKISSALLRADWARATHLHEIKKALDRVGVPIEERSLEQLNALGGGHQGVALGLEESPAFDWAKLERAESARVLVLDGIEDPQNLGSILRTGWLSGVDGVLIPADRAVGLTPTVCKVACGGVEHVPVEESPSLQAPMQRLKDMGFWLYGLSERGTSRPWDLRLPVKVAWVVGAEGAGLRVNTERACDELVRIPQVGTGSSYNAAVAVAMALAETVRQQGFPS